MTREELDTVIRYIERYSKKIAKIAIDDNMTFTSASSRTVLVVIPRYKDQSIDALAEAKEWFRDDEFLLSASRQIE